SALARGLTGWILALFAYVEPQTAGGVPAQPDSAIMGIRLLTGPIPAFFFVLGIVVLSFYPITRSVYDEIMKKVEAREQE
ncbi:MAG: MFS transporter, partial [Spirochaetota bacterium]